MNLDTSTDPHISTSTRVIEFISHFLLIGNEVSDVHEPYPVTGPHVNTKLALLIKNITQADQWQLSRVMKNKKHSGGDESVALTLESSSAFVTYEDDAGKI